MNAIVIPLRDLSPLMRVLNRIEDPAARKTVIMAKRQRGQVTDAETEFLIRELGLKHA